MATIQWLGSGFALAIGLVIGWLAKVGGGGALRCTPPVACRLPPTAPAGLGRSSPAFHLTAPLPAPASLQARVDEGGYDSDESQEAGAGGGRRRRGGGPASLAAPREELKMVLVVNDELKMGKGKIGEAGEGRGRFFMRLCRKHAKPTSACCLCLGHLRAAAGTWRASRGSLSAPAALHPCRRLQAPSARTRRWALWSGCTNGARRPLCTSGRRAGSPRSACAAPPRW